MDVETQNLREFNPREKFSGVNIAIPFTRTHKRLQWTLTAA